MADGTKKNIMFKRSDDINCDKCVLHYESYSKCRLFGCIELERDDGLRGIYVEVKE